METILRKGFYEILKVFYDNRNKPVYLRELARKTKLNTNSVSRFLNELVRQGVLISRKEDSLRKFYIAKDYEGFVFSFFDFYRFDSLSFIIKKSISDFIYGLKKKPFCLVLFGSYAKGHNKKDSDLDLLAINYSSEDISVLLKKVEAERGVKIQVHSLKLNDFKKAFSSKDSLVMSAIETGFPVFGKDFFYGVLKNE